MTLRLLPQTLYGRLVLLLFASFIGVQAVIAVIVFSQLGPVGRSEVLVRDLAARINPIVRVVELTKTMSPELVGNALRDLGVTMTDDVRQFASAAREIDSVPPILDALRSAVRDAQVLELRRPVSTSPEHHLSVGSEIDVLIRVADGRAFIYSGVLSSGAFVPLRTGLLLDIGIRLFGVVLVALLLTRWLVSPLNRLANHADALGCDLDATPIVESGPREVQRAARAFNQMQSRLKNYLEERTRMLTAVSHDLRTPITRVLLRLEMMPKSDARDRSIADLSQLTEMVNETLEFARGERNATLSEPLPIGALLNECVVATNSIAVKLQVSTEYLVNGKRSSLIRLFSNLIENALRYGSCARIDYAVASAYVVITVDDDGPGIPIDEIDRVLEPFYRVEKSRNLGSGGKGLGLSIARDIARAHGGELRLSNRAGGGLRATVTLPKLTSAQQ
jgi:signal transduction histidine kinase